DGLPGEDGGAFGHGPDVAGKAERAQIVQKFGGEGVFGAEICDVLLVEVQIPNVGDHLLQACGNGKAAAVGHAAEKDVKVTDLVGDAGLEIAVAHGQLVKVGEHGVVDVVFHR